jgi:hypothetical protein
MGISGQSMASILATPEYCSAATRRNAMSKTKGSSDEAIGRPGEWREGRYQTEGGPVDRSVEPPPNTDQPPDVVSTPVTQKDYEQSEAAPTERRSPAKSER